MRKVLISILLILLIVLAYFAIFQGISIGTFKVLSTGEIIELNDNLTVKITDVNKKIKTDLKQKRDELKENINTLLDNKESYYNLANVSTESEITEASTEEVYNIEYLWVRVGRHARAEGVNMRMDVLAGNGGEASVKNLNFTAVGKYMAIMDFVSSLEDDSELGFRIEDFYMVPATDGTNLQATFSVTGIRVKTESTTASVNTTSSSTAEQNAKDTNTNDSNAENAENNNNTNEAAQ